MQRKLFGRRLEGTNVVEVTGWGAGANQVQAPRHHNVDQPDHFVLLSRTLSHLQHQVGKTGSEAMFSKSDYMRLESVLKNLTRDLSQGLKAQPQEANLANLLMHKIAIYLDYLSAVSVDELGIVRYAGTLTELLDTMEVSSFAAVRADVTNLITIVEQIAHKRNQE